MKLFRYDADRIPVLCFTLLFGLDLLVFFLVDSLAFVSAWMVSGIFPKACISSFGHHQHYKDQALDESCWQREDGRTMGALEYSVVLFGTS